MYCSHGFLEDDCPHCRAQHMVKPTISLVELAPTELPLDNPVVCKFQQAKTVPSSEIISNNSLLSRNIPKLSRTTGLGQDLNAGGQSLLAKRLEQLNDLHGGMQTQKDIDANMPLVDLKKVYTQKK